MSEEKGENITTCSRCAKNIHEKEGYYAIVQRQPNGDIDFLEHWCNDCAKETGTILAELFSE